MAEEFDFEGGDRPPKIPTPAEREASEKIMKRMATAERCGLIFLAGCICSMGVLIYCIGKQEGIDQERNNKEKGFQR